MPLFAAIAKAWTIQRTVRDLSRLDWACRDPRRTQQDYLLQQLRRETSTGFGRDHHFAEIRKVEDFRKRVPISRYEDLEPYIERVKQGEVEALFHKQRVQMFALTSGTTTSRKFIPVTDRALSDYRRMWTAWGFLAYLPHKGLFRHARLTFASDWDEFRTVSDVPCGSISGLTAQLQSGFVRQGYVLPPEAAKVSQTRAKYYLAWRLGAIRTIGAWMSPNPSTLLNLAKLGTVMADSLLRDIHDGGLTSEFEWSPEMLRAVSRQLKPQPQRARELGRLLEQHGALRPRDVWPELKLIGCWTGGSMQAYLRSFPEWFGDVTIRDLGLIASEGRMTFPIADGTSSGVLETVSGFYEFIPVEEIDSSQPTVLQAHELQEGRDYYILLTNASGLYRYNIWDVVRCTGWHHATPLLAFLNKGGSISSMTGEKLTEYQVVSSVSDVLSRRQATLGTYSLVPCWDEQLPNYVLLIDADEPLARADSAEWLEHFDRLLRASNTEYDTKRQSGRLGPVTLQRLESGTWKAWDEARRQARGGTAEQYKHPCLISDLEFLKSMQSRFAPSSPDTRMSLRPPARV